MIVGPTDCGDHAGFHLHSPRLLCVTRENEAHCLLTSVQKPSLVLRNISRLRSTRYNGPVHKGKEGGANISNAKVALRCNI